MSSTPQPQRLEVKLDALITLVAKSLYSDELTCIRELLANAMDAMSKRQHHPTQAHPADGLRCEIYYDDHDRALVVRDNGIGLTETEMRDFLTSIGRSGTREMRQQLADPALTRKLIGNFGIGILSAFIIGDRITVHSRAVGSGTGEGRMFSCTQGGEYDIRPAPRDQVGTTVRVFVFKQEHVKLLREQLGERARAYSLLLPYPVEGQGGLPRYNVPTSQVPWRGAGDARTFLGQHLRLPAPLLHFQIKRDDIQLGGLVWVPADTTFLNTSGSADLYVKGMLVRQGAVGILPDKAVFLAAAVECDTLEPTASREDVKRDDAFAVFRAEVDSQVLAGLCGLATRPAELQQVLLAHGRELKGLLMSETGTRPITVSGRQTCLFDELVRFIPFRRPQDAAPQITLAEYEDRATELVRTKKLDEQERNRIYYTSTDSSTSIQIQSVLVKRGIQVLVLDEKRPDGHAPVDYLLVKRYAERAHKELKAAEEREDLFPRVEGDIYRELERLFDRVAGPPAAAETILPPGVRSFRFQVSEFHPKDIPILLVAHKHDQVNDAMTQLAPSPDMPEGAREMFNRILRLAKDQIEATEGQMTALINAANPLIQRMVSLGRDYLHASPSLFTVARELMHYALVYSGYTFGSSALGMLRDQKMWLLTMMLHCRDHLDSASQQCVAEYQALRANLTGE